MTHAASKPYVRAMADDRGQASQSDWQIGVSLIGPLPQRLEVSSSCKTSEHARCPCYGRNVRRKVIPGVDCVRQATESAGSGKRRARQALATAREQVFCRNQAAKSQQHDDYNSHCAELEQDLRVVVVCEFDVSRNVWWLNALERNRIASQTCTNGKKLFRCLPSGAVHQMAVSHAAQKVRTFDRSP